MADRYSRFNRADQIDRAVNEAVTGVPTPAPRPRPTGSRMAESKKPKWQRAGMTRSEYERTVQQHAEERRARAARQERLERTRRGQSNPGN